MNKEIIHWTKWQIIEEYTKKSNEKKIEKEEVKTIIRKIIDKEFIRKLQLETKEQRKWKTERQIKKEKEENAQKEKKIKIWKNRLEEKAKLRKELEHKLKKKGKKLIKEEGKKNDWIEIATKQIDELNEVKKENREKKTREKMEQIIKGKGIEKKTRKIITWNADAVGEKNIRELCRNLQLNRVDMAAIQDCAMNNINKRIGNYQVITTENEDGKNEEEKHGIAIIMKKETYDNDCIGIELEEKNCMVAYMEKEGKKERIINFYAPQTRGGDERERIKRWKKK